MKKALSLLLSVMMIITMSAGLNFTAKAEESARVYIGSINSGEGIDLTYTITADGEAISTQAIGTLGNYEVTNGTLVMPSNEKAYIELPVGAQYSIAREAYKDADNDIPAQEAVTGEVVSNIVYIETAGNLNVDIGDSSFNGIPKEITKEEYDKATNNGESAVATYYFYYCDAKNNDLETRVTADDVELCTPVSLTSGVRYRLKSEKLSYKYASLSLTSNTQVTEVPLFNKNKYVITGDATATIGNGDTKAGKYLTLTSDTFEEARTKAVTNSKAALKTAIMAAVSDAFKTEGKSVASEVNIDTIITPDIFVEANTSANILKMRTLGLFEFSPYIAVNYNYSTDTDYDRNVVLFGTPTHTHNYDAVVTEPTCTEKGYTTHTCECGDSYVDTYTDATGHNFEASVVAPTCTLPGYTVHTCKCGDSYIDTYTDANGHTLSEVVTKPTCTSIGYTTHTCSVCGHSYKNSYKAVDSGNHTAKKTTLTRATLKADGSITTTCDSCKKVVSSTVIAKPATIKLSATEYVYDGKAKKPKVTVKDSNGKTISSKNYKATYAKGRKNVGKYKVTITFTGNYKGTKKLYFKINPKGTSVSKLTAKKKALTVKWKKQTKQVKGYEIQCSTDKSFKKDVKSVKIKKNKTTSTTIKKLKGGKKYYVRVRTYKTVDGKDFYSAWSKVKSVKTKK